MTTPYRKKLIEVALPLEAINVASAREKSIRHGHPSTLHLWWARRPLAACRAVLFSSLVDDPGEPGAPAEYLALVDRLPIPVEDKPNWPKLNLEERRRRKLCGFVARLVQWENTTDPDTLTTARELIFASCEGHPPAVHDPFCGGGSIPLEAQRLGLEAHGSDLNPVAVLITKAMIEIPPRFAGRPPVNPESRDKLAHGGSWPGATGLAEDVRYYGKWMRDEAEKRIGHLYPPVEITPEMVAERPDLKQYLGRKLTVIAWIWARTVKSPNPAFRNVDVPLASTFMLSTKPGKEAYVEPVIEADGYRFAARTGAPPDLDTTKRGTKLSRGANFRCIMSDTPIDPDYIKAEGRAGRMGARMMAVVVDGVGERIYIAPSSAMEDVAGSAKPTWRPDVPLPDDPRSHWTPAYGLTAYGDLFGPRQLVAMETYAALIEDARHAVLGDASQCGLRQDDISLRDGGSGAQAYADAVTVYLAFALDKLSTTTNSVCTWQTDPTRLVAAFSRQGIPMTWDYAEANAFGGAAGDMRFPIQSVIEVLWRLPGQGSASVVQRDARSAPHRSGVMMCTDPPYYDNIGYADLSGFFYLWLRRVISAVFPELFATLGVPKSAELVANPYRHGGKEQAEAHFLRGMGDAMRGLVHASHKEYPVTIFYAFKQAETGGDGETASTGWETFLDGVITAGFAVTGTWPVRTELTVALKSRANALASSIVLVCRPRATDAQTVMRREFVAALRRELEEALLLMMSENIAPVDLPQASIGPGMAVYTRYAKVVEADGSALSVRTALQIINAELDTILAAQEGDYDADTRWCVAWFEQYGFGEGPYGDADNMARAKNTGVDGLQDAGVLTARGGKVKLLAPKDYGDDWDPKTDKRLPIWEATHRLLHAQEKSSEDAGKLLTAMGAGLAEQARDLAYRLYTICERKGRSAEALAYNGLVTSWVDMKGAAARQAEAEPRTGTLPNLEEV